MKLVKCGKTAVAGLCILATLTGSLMVGCSPDSNAISPSQKPSGANTGSSSSSSSTLPEEDIKVPDRKDFSAYPISDPSTWIYADKYKYNFKVLDTGEVLSYGATHVSVIPAKVPDDEIYLDGYPFDMILGSKYVWDGENLRCYYKSTVKPVAKENLTYKEGYKCVCSLGLFGILSGEPNWVKDEDVAQEIEKMSKDACNVVAIDGVLLNQWGNIAYESYWHDGNYYWIKRN